MNTRHQSGSMEKDCKIRRAVFIDRSVEVREQLHYGDTKEVLKVINVYCCDGYGAMLWRQNSDTSEMYFKSWNTAVKLTHKVRRNTFTYLTEGYLAGQEKYLSKSSSGTISWLPAKLVQLPKQRSPISEPGCDSRPKFNNTL